MSTYARWRETWRALGARADRKLYRNLVARYREPHRRYHTLEHLACCFERFDEARALAVRPGEVALALWFHDAEYEPRRTDNEARSATWARGAIAAAGLSAAVGARVGASILATRHRHLPRDPDARLVVDIDLAILGAEPERFDAYERRIREEYAGMPEAEFRAGRGALLERLQARTTLYGTPHFQSCCERRARLNIARSLERMKHAP